MKSVVTLLILLGSAPLLFAEEALLTWDPSSDADVVGYKVYVGTASQDYVESVDAGNTTQYILSVGTPGVHYFAVTAYNALGQESDFSNEVSKEMSGAPSASPGGGDGGGGGCALRLASQGGPLEAAEMLALIAAIFFLTAKRILPSLSNRRQAGVQ